jgi:hypothetical protein
VIDGLTARGFASVRMAKEPIFRVNDIFRPCLFRDSDLADVKVEAISLLNFSWRRDCN